MIFPGKLHELTGVRVKVSPLCTRTGPARLHKKRRNQTDSYHKRVQKKWLKRFGEKATPNAFLVNEALIGGAGRVLYIHHELWERLKTQEGLQ